MNFVNQIFDVVLCFTEFFGIFGQGAVGDKHVAAFSAYVLEPLRRLERLRLLYSPGNQVVMISHDF